jgi:hypothetical protein
MLLQDAVRLPATSYSLVCQQTTVTPPSVKAHTARPTASGPALPCPGSSTTEAYATYTCMYNLNV